MLDINWVTAILQCYECQRLSSFSSHFCSSWAVLFRVLFTGVPEVMKLGCGNWFLGRSKDSTTEASLWNITWSLGGLFFHVLPLLLVSTVIQRTSNLAQSSGIEGACAPEWQYGHWSLLSSICPEGLHLVINTVQWNHCDLWVNVFSGYELLPCYKACGESPKVHMWKCSSTANKVVYEGTHTSVPVKWEEEKLKWYHANS